MVGGDGPHSYAKNSIYQEAIVNGSKGMIAAGIRKTLDLKSLRLDTSSTFKIADLGCSTGPNTFIAMQNIIEAIELIKYQDDCECEHDNPSGLEFQVFFNDHSNNDFNTLFKSVPLSQKYFATGVPGSFHGRLFPESSLHVAHTSNALPWLSKIPKEITNSNSPAWNRGHILCSGFEKEVAEAYSAQFKNDIESFLNARAQELVPGGLLLLLTPTIRDGIPMFSTPEGTNFDYLGSCLYDLANMGLIAEEKVDSFNVPMYYPFLGELMGHIKRNKNFSIEIMNTFTHPLVHMVYSAEFWASLSRAAFGGLVGQHFGYQFVDRIFNYYSTKLAENMSSICDGKTQGKIELFVLLRRN
ncbi:putative S-adenosylmethionine-dependent methyltransferase [Citrus sinensis]|nr:putative S-adenosylmethionine-dependent methyltransferase [Citrus sinensis]